MSIQSTIFNAKTFKKNEIINNEILLVNSLKIIHNKNSCTKCIYTFFLFIKFISVYSFEVGEINQSCFSIPH